MAAAALVAAPEAIELARGSYSEARRVGSEISHAIGLTREEDYEGWFALAIIAYALLAEPIRTAWHIEKQVAGVLDQLYTWLGGAGSAVNAGVSSIEAAASAAWSAVTRWV